MSLDLRSALLPLVAGLSLVGCAADQPEYSYSGPTGPAYWGDLKPAWRIAKTGTQQSPVDIQDAQEMAGMKIGVDYLPTPLDLRNDGHTIQLHWQPGSTFTLGEETYALKHVQFRAPSEHLVNGVHKAMEAQLVHTNDVGQVLILSVLMNVGEPNGFLAGFWDELPPRPEDVREDTGTPVDVRELIPGSLDSWRYLGSLTAPPCTEGVIWIVLQTEGELSAEQVGEFTGLIGPNNRPPQQLHGRIIKSVPGGG